MDSVRSVVDRASHALVGRPKISHLESGCPIFAAGESSFLDPSAIPRTQTRRLPIKGAFVVKGCMTREETAAAVRLAEECGFTEAKVSVGAGRMVSAPEYRTNSRVIWQATASHLAPLWKRLRPSIPKRYVREGSVWVPVGLNERIRFYKYLPGEQFKRHFDGGFCRRERNARGNVERSFMTLIVYLNHVPKEGGGATSFFDSRRGEDSATPTYACAAEQGKALLFWHDHPDSPLHEGSVLKRGTKYAFRSDVMFEKLSCESDRTERKRMDELRREEDTRHKAR
jgi:hypothetical protein